jgi:molecular chaperone DnaK (HSP70)
MMITRLSIPRGGARGRCDNAKRTLSAATSATVELEGVGEGGDEDYVATISRAKFEELNRCATLMRRRARHCH